jgi:hypothetical protein
MCGAGLSSWCSSLNVCDEASQEKGGLSEGILFQFIRQYFSFTNALSSLINGPCHSPIQCVDQGTQLLDECRR